MKKILLTLFLIGLSYLCQASGFVLTVENDIVFHTDNNYSHGTEMARSTTHMDKNGIITRYDYGINQLMYTPEDISISSNQLNDRPWCGTLTAFVDHWYNKPNGDLVKMRFSIGVLGPASLSEQSQKEVHRLVDDEPPMGWDNQLPNEPILNVRYELYHPLMQLGKEPNFRFLTEGIYGGDFGTTFIDGLLGTSAKLGWIPSTHRQGGIAPKAAPTPKPFIYLIGQVDGILQLHNATLGDSYFHNMDEEERDLVPFVGEVHWGLSTGYKSFSLTYLKSIRTREFEKQPSMMDWGMIRLEFAVPY